ncbi:hypothetical protein N9X05_16380 [Paracoccaceae bacterium]|nr:hypothetical protein [Paracoccaceae bacterium]
MFDIIWLLVWIAPSQGGAAIIISEIERKEDCLAAIVEMEQVGSYTSSFNGGEFIKDTGTYFCTPAPFMKGTDTYD